MKKSLIFGLIATIGLIGCTRNQEIEIPEATLSLFARTESPADTKTVVESGTHVFWEPGDEIAVFMGEKSAKFTTDITAASGAATFKGTFGDQGWPEEPDIWAVYPFSEEATFDGETITTTLPSEQIAREGSFGKDMNLAIAHSNSSTLQFYNVGGGIRFSVTEEGIKKVMFEGMSGEIISGKVKIGLDENGLPVVKEVSGGSQFITLLPPFGKETFEKDTWYYIVAIPGTLEGGYKLRFYKDSDYARKVSEKKVEIKRSIYGSLEKADMGIEYEATTTHFPETKEEWEESVELTYSVGDKLKGLLRTYKEDNDFEQFKKGLETIDGVLFVSFADDTSSVSLLQRDSIWFNHVFNTKNDILVSENESEITTTAYQIRPNLLPRKQSNTIHNVESGSALIFAPFQMDFKEPLYDWENTLSEFFTEVTVLKKEDTIDNAGVLQLKDAFSNHYDFILLSTHGGVMQSYNDKNFVSYTLGTNKKTCIATSTIYNSGTFDSLISRGLTTDDFAISSAGDDDSTVYVWITTSFLGESRFDKSCVILSACSTAQLIEYSDDDDKGSMVGAFINRGASIVTGAKVDMKSSALELFVDKCLEYMSNGLSFQKSFSYLSEKGGKLDSWLRIWFEYKRDHVSFWKYLSYKSWNIPDNYIAEMNKKECEPFFFFNPFPIIDEIKPQGMNVDLHWECRLNSFSINWYYDIVNGVSQKKDYPYNVLYDVYVDGTRLDNSIDPDNTDKKASCILPPGDHSWHVVAVIMEGDEALTSYQSREGYFTVEEETVDLEAIDMGLSVKWANLNIGANSPEKSGDYFAWGETEPYYTSLEPLIWKSDKAAGYSWQSYKWCMGTYSNLTKYCTNPLYGYNGYKDKRTILEEEDDAAHVNLGGKWRMPTKYEFDELRNSCSWVWTTKNGIKGYRVTGPSGKDIFIPASGSIYEVNYSLNNTAGLYWSSMNKGTDGAYSLYFTNEKVSESSYSRYAGYSIRPVYGDARIPVDTVYLSKSFLELSVGSTSTLIANVYPSNATIKNVSWSSSNESVATVTSNGVVKGVSPGSVIITVTTADGGNTDICRVNIKGSYSVVTPSIVDLGLSVKWASFNLGATKAEEFGDYFAWGDSQPSGGYWDAYKWCMGSVYSLIKYCTRSAEGFNGFSDEKTELDFEDDAVRVTLGGKWRMPTYSEANELINKCQWEWISYHGVNGYKVTGPNNNWIFLPGAQKFQSDEDGVYWTSSTVGDITAFSIYFQPNQTEAFILYEHRCWGHSIRPVYAE